METGTGERLGAYVNAEQYARVYSDEVAKLPDADLRRTIELELRRAAVWGGLFHDHCAQLLDECRRRNRLDLYGAAYEAVVARR